MPYTNSLLHFVKERIEFVGCKRRISKLDREAPDLLLDETD